MSRPIFMQITACLFRNRMEREVTRRDRTSISPPRYHAGHYSQSPSRFHDDELSFQRQEQHAGPRTQAPFRARRSQSPAGNGPGVNVTEKSWSRRYYLFFTSWGALAGIQEETCICAVAESWMWHNIL